MSEISSVTAVGSSTESTLVVGGSYIALVCLNSGFPGWAWKLLLLVDSVSVSSFRWVLDDLGHFVETCLLSRAALAFSETLGTHLESIVGILGSIRGN